MWPNVSLNDVLLVTFYGLYLEQRVMNTFHYFLQSVAGTARNLDEYYDDFATDATMADLIDKYVAVLPDQYTLSELWVQLIAPDRYAKKTYTLDDPGILTTLDLTANIQASISRNSFIADRHSQGGIRLIAPSNATYVANGYITPAYKALLDPLAAAMKNDVVTTVGGSNITARPCLFHFNADGQPIVRPQLDTTVRDTVRTMRRRTVGRGI